MKIKMLQAARVGNQPTKIGDVYDASDDEGKRLIKEGAAEAVKEAHAADHKEVAGGVHPINLHPKTHKMVKDEDAG